MADTSVHTQRNCPAPATLCSSSGVGVIFSGMHWSEVCQCYGYCQVCRQHDCSTPVRILVDVLNLSALTFESDGADFYAFTGPEVGSATWGNWSLYCDQACEKFNTTFIGWHSIVMIVKVEAWQDGNRMGSV